MSLAFLVLPIALLQAQAAAPAAAEAPAVTPGARVTSTDVPRADPSAARLQHCLATVQAAPEQGYEEAMAWAADTHEADAYDCSAVALIAMGHTESGARRFHQTAMGLSASDSGGRATLLSKSGNAYLLAHLPAPALAEFNEAVRLMGNSRAALPDLLIDRARAYAMQNDYRHAEEDLSHALDLRQQDPLALRLRADARMRQHAFDLAEADAQAAVNLEPANVDARLVLGNVREAKRTGEPPLN